MKQCITNILILFALPLAVWADKLPAQSPSAAGLSETRLERIAELTQAHVDAGHIAGAVCLIARDGKVAYIEPVGYADRENELPMKTDTIFRIYSMSKPITSVAVMILFEEGKFLLTDPVEKFMPELGDRTVVEFAIDLSTSERKMKGDRKPSNRSITIQDLLRHTSGYTYGLGADAYDRLYREKDLLLGDDSLADTLRKLKDLPLKHNPGAEWTYGVNTDILARLVEVVSGQSFDTFLQERIFDPLGMEDTFFWVPPQKTHRLAQLYTRDDEGALFANPGITRSYMGTSEYTSGGAGLLSTAPDYFRFCQMLLNGGTLDGQQILSPKTVELMRSDALDDIPASFQWSDGAGFGLGFQVTTDLGATGMLGSVGEYGWGGAAGTRFWIDPKERLITLYMVQVLPHTGLTYSSQIKNLVYQAIVESYE